MGRAVPALIADRRPDLGHKRRRSGLYELLPWLLVRAPLLPVEAYRALSGWSRGSEQGRPIDRMARADPRIRTAIAVASQDLIQALERPLRRERDAARADAKLLRYLIRMSTRPTPYGLFAGVALASWSDATDLSLSRRPPRTRTRPDAAWLLSLVDDLEARPEVRRRLRLFRNPLAFEKAGRVFVGERVPGVGAVPAGTAVSARATGVVRRVLAAARTPVPYEQLAADLLSVPGSTSEKVDKLLAELCRQTILLTDLRPPLTVSSPARHVLERLEAIPEAHAEAAGLRAVLHAASEWDGDPWEQGEAGYAHVATIAKSARRQKSSPPLQVDMAMLLHGRSIARRVGEEVLGAAEVLLRLTTASTGPPSLAPYRRAFEARYGQDQEVPLLQLLDPNFGLGPPARHAHGASLEGFDHQRAARRQQALRDLALGALRDRQLVVELDEKLLRALETWTPSALTAPRSLELSVFVVSQSREAIEAGDFSVMVGPNLGAPAAGRNLGRFADLLGREAAAALRMLAEIERSRSPSRLFAEVVYLPHRSRSANVAIRPLTRDYEIAVGTTPSAGPERTIPLEELVVGIHEGRFYIRWPARNAEIVACAGHMLNSAQAPEVCRFLDDVARDGVAQIGGFDWGPASGFPFLPRVQTGRVVLSPAQWIVDTEAPIYGLAVREQQTFGEHLKAWREQWGVPRHVYLSIGDNRLMLDVDDHAQADLLRAEIAGLKEGGRIVVQEALPGPEDAWMPGPGGRFMTELVVPLVLRGPEERTYRRPASRVAMAEAIRVRPPGSDWLFAKLYCPPALETDLIVGPMRDFCEAVTLSGMARDWFFIRYADPDQHIRLRFRGAPDALTTSLLPELCSWAGSLMAEGICARFGFDTYERELERYGGPEAASAAEDLFVVDSRAVVECLALLEGGSLPIDLLTLAILGIDDMLAGLGLREEERVNWYRDQATTSPATGQLYRDRQRDLRRLLSGSGEVPGRPELAPAADVMTHRRRALQDVAARLDELAERGQLAQSKSKLYQSFVHLHCNRLAGADRSVEERALGLLFRTRYGLLIGRR